MLPDLDSLALFVRAAETGNLTKAAEECFITVPAASRRLAILEHQLKTQLFVRHSRGLELTPSGERLLKSARDVIAGVHQLRADMANYAVGSHTVLRVHANTSAMAQFLPADIASFQAVHADMRVLLKETWSREAVRQVHSGEAQLGVVVEGVDTGDLRCVRYRSDRLAAVVRDDQDALGDAVAFAELLDHDLIGLEEGSSLTRLLVAQASHLMRPLRLRVQVRSFEVVCRMVEARLGVGVLPLHAARSFAASMGLRVLPLKDSWARRRMLLCAKGDVEPGSAIATLIAHLGACTVDD